MHTRRLPWRNRGRDQDDISTGQETLKSVCKLPEAAGKRLGTDFFPHCPQKEPAFNTLILTSGLLNWEK